MSPARSPAASRTDDDVAARSGGGGRPRRPRQRPHRDPDLARRLVERHGPERIVAALDVRDGRALGDGWVRDARGTDALELARALASGGLRPLAVTADRA